MKKSCHLQFTRRTSGKFWTRLRENIVYYNLIVTETKKKQKKQTDQNRVWKVEFNNIKS